MKYRVVKKEQISGTWYEVQSRFLFVWITEGYFTTEEAARIAISNQTIKTTIL